MKYLSRRVRYWFDNTMTRGTPALIGWLLLLSLVLVVILSTLIMFATPHAEKANTAGNALKEIWSNTVTTFRLGSGKETRVLLVALQIMLAAAGIFFASTLIGLLTSGVSKRIQELRKGRSMVLERDHTVIIGWSDEIFTVLSGLVEANRTRRRPAVAVVADMDRTEMDDLVRRRLKDTGNTRVICRSGRPTDPGDIDIANLAEARSIIVLRPPGDKTDSQVIKTLLAITSRVDPQTTRFHVTVPVAGGKNLAAAKLAGGGVTEVLDIDDIVARLLVQSCLQPGLSVVYSNLFDFSGDDIYIRPEPSLAGSTFGNALQQYRTSSLIGLWHADHTVRLCPPMDQVITATDMVVVISRDAATIVVADGHRAVDDTVISSTPPSTQSPQKTVLLGWNRRGPAVIREFGNYASPGSRLHVVSPTSDDEAAVDEAAQSAPNLTVSFVQADTSDRGELELAVTGQYDHVIVLSDDRMNQQDADAATLVTLLQLRDMQTQHGWQYTIVSEMADSRNCRLASTARVDDFVVSEKLISMLISQISEDRNIARVYDTLLDSSGAEIYLRPATDYILADRDVDFHTVVEAARRRREVAIGYQITAAAADPPSYGITLNPDKTLKLRLGHNDNVIVVAED